MKGFVEQGVCSELVNVSVADLTQFEDVLVGFLGAASLYTIYCRSYLWCLEFTVGIAMYTSAWSSCQNAQHLLSIFGGGLSSDPCLILLLHTSITSILLLSARHL